MNEQIDRFHNLLILKSVPNVEKRGWPLKAAGSGSFAKKVFGSTCLGGEAFRPAGRWVFRRDAAGFAFRGGLNLGRWWALWAGGAYLGDFSAVVHVSGRGRSVAAAGRRVGGCLCTALWRTKG